MATPSLRLDQSQFASVLLDRLDRYFVERNVSRKGDRSMTAKVVGGLAAWAISYLALLLFRGDAIYFVALYLLHGAAHTFLFLNIGHDSNHNAVSPRTSVNRLLSYVMDLCGINSYIWRLVHHRGHHSCINVHSEDEAILGRRLFRFTPLAPRRWYHRFQHLYAFLFYGLSSLDYVLLKDFEYFFVTRYGLLRTARHPAIEYAVLFAGKLFYVAYMIALPVLIGGRPLPLVLLSFLLMHVFMGITTLCIFQTTHVVETSQFPRGRTEFENYTFHIFATTADYATDNSVATWCIGGLNQHVVHHLCPNVCHTHYQALTRIVKETAREYQIPYREHRTIWQALVQHFLLLRRLGRET